MCGFLRGWLRNEDLASCCRYANAAGAFAVSRLGCSSAYPSWTELQYFVSHGSKHKWLREDAMLEQIHWATNRRNKWKRAATPRPLPLSRIWLSGPWRKPPRSLKARTMWAFS